MADDELRVLAVSYALLDRAADELGWREGDMIARDRDARGGLMQEGLGGATASETPRARRISALRSLADQAQRGGDYRKSARAFESVLRLVVPKRRASAPKEFTHAVPEPIGGEAITETPVDLARVRKLFDNGLYREGLAMLTRELATKGDARAIPLTRAGLKEVGVSMHVVRRAAEGLGWPNDRFHALKVCRAQVAPSQARAWWLWLQQKLPGLVGSEDEPVAALLDNARDLTTRELADEKTIAAIVPRSAQARLRSQLIESRAALASGQTRWAESMLGEIAARAPHVTIAHQMLGRMAFKNGHGFKAAQHFQAAMLSPNSAEWLADQAERAPCRMTTLKGKWDVYCFRGQVFVAQRDNDSIGVTLQANRLFAVRNTRGYRQWRRISHLVRTFLPGARARTGHSGTQSTGGRGSRAFVARVLRGLIARVPSRVKSAVTSIARRGRRAVATLTRPLVRLGVAAKLRVIRYWIGAKPLASLSGPNVVDGVFQIVRRGSG